MREDGGSYPELLKSEGPRVKTRFSRYIATKTQNRSVTKCQQVKCESVTWIDFPSL